MHVIFLIYFSATCNDGEVHLVGGTTPLDERVEVCYNNQWGGVCSRTSWWPNQATVVCRQLGYPYGAIAYSSSYGYATSTAFLNVDYCDIRADQLVDCSNSALGYYNCTDYSNFEVMCASKGTGKRGKRNGEHLFGYLHVPLFPVPTPEYCSGTCTNGTIRLVGGPSPYKGRVEVCVGGCWGTVCGNYFGVPGASVVCRELGYPTFGVFDSF